MIPPVMSSFILRMLRGEQPLIYGTGEKRRDFIYIDDLAEGVAHLASHAAFAAEALNLGSGRPTPIAEACGVFLRALGWHGEHAFSGDAIPGNPLRMEADMTRTFALGFRPRVDLDEGLGRTAAWIKTEGDR